MAAFDDNLSLSSESDAELDQVDLFHATREKAMLELYGKEGRFSAVKFCQDDAWVSGDSETEEVMQLNLSSGEGDSHPDLWSSDEEAHGDGTVAVEGWGKQKSTYYAEDGDGEREGLEEELEEREAIGLQQQQSALLSEGDFEADFSDSEKLSSDANVMYELNPKETFPVTSQLHPELPNIIQHVQHSIKFLLRSVPHMDTSHPTQMKTLFETNVLLKFCHSLNSMFYLLLITHSIPVISHPVTRTLLHLQKLVDKMAAVNKLAQRKRVLTSSASCQLHQKAHSSLPPEIKGSSFSEESPLSFYHRVDAEMWHKNKSKEKSEVMYAQRVEPLEGKRAITYQIARNKGIGERTKRRLRNPRVKHKLKYKKALLKRKSQVLPVVMEISKYGGETTGIKANLSRSTKITF